MSGPEIRTPAQESVIRLPPETTAWIEEVTASTVTYADRQAGGGRKEAWFVDATDASGVVTELFLRWDRSDPTITGDPWTVRREAAVYRALRDTPVPVARFVAMHPTAQAMLATRVHGKNWFSHITDPAEQLSTAQDFIGHLAQLHRLDIASLDLPEWDVSRSVAKMVGDQLDEMDALVAFRGGEREPLLELAVRWLRANVPVYDGPVVIVQGDTGPGNFMYESGRVTAIVDWELAHPGDPMDDLAWVSLRATQEPFTDLRDRFREYATLSGHAIDVDRIRYYRVLAEAKILVMNHGVSLKPSSESDGSDAGARLIFGQLHHRLCAEALADVLGVTLPEVDLPAPPDDVPTDHLFDVVLSQLRDVITPRISDSYAIQRTKGLARVLKYLATVSRLGPGFDAQELDDLTSLLADRPSAVAAGRAALGQAIRNDEVSAPGALRVIYRQLLRDNELLRSASGVLAARHYSTVV